MKRQRDFEALLANLADRYDEIEDTYNAALREAESRDSDWVKKRTSLRKAVFDIVKGIQDRTLREKALSEIVEMRYRFNTKEQFARLCYYVDCLNKIHVKKKVRKANPDYGKSVVESIGRCASQILGYLIYTDESRRADLAPAKAQAKEKIKQQWEETFNGPMKTLAEAEARDIIAAIEAEVGGRHG